MVHSLPKFLCPQDSGEALLCPDAPVFTAALGTGCHGAVFALPESPRSAAMTLHGYMLAAELQFLNEPHSGCDQALFGPAPRPINAIFLLGPMAALASLWKPGPWLRGARLIIFIDNEHA